VIVAAGLLVLVGLGLFVAGLLTEITAFYWACVAACVVAAVVLYLARRRMTAEAPAPAAAVPVGAAAAPAAGGGAAGRHAGAAGAAGATAASTSAATATPAPAEQVAPAAAAAAGSSAVVSGPPAAVPDLTTAVPPVVTPPAVTTPARSEPTGAARSSAVADHGDAGEPPVEEVEVTDLLLVVDLKEEVLVVDEHPRYHVEGCRHLTGQETIPIPMDEARTDGFTPCGTCRPDATLAERVRSRE
jgi:hypothetical protein